MKMIKTTKKKSRAGIARTDTVFKIFNLFIKPLIKEFVVPPTATENVLHRKLEMWFNKDERDIWDVKCRVPFIIVGPRWMSLSTPERFHVYGDGDRTVSKGDYLCVRTDIRTPDIVEVQFKEQVFVMRATEWSVLSEKVEWIR